MKKLGGAVSGGFTLVELLIVIALISILSVAVLATINPIEQSNKARDAKFKNDTAEVLGAIERYYASNNVYPWNAGGVGTTIASGTEIGIGSTGTLFGVLGAGSSDGVLITTSELKSSFKGKAPFDSAGTELIDMMYVYHNGGDVNYVCFVPKANVNRVGAVAADLKCLVQGTGGSVDLIDLGERGCAAMTGWTTPADYAPAGTRANLICVPEGTVPDPS